MIKKQNYKKLLHALLALFLLVVTVIGGWGILPAFADISRYSGVLTDLKKDGDFNVADYPDNAKDYSIKVIQIAESTDGELFLYTYQPSQKTTYLVATDINMSLSESVSGTQLYGLTLVSANGVLCKYKVNELTVSEKATRYYNITSVYRKWIKGVDKETENDNTINEVSFEVGKLFIVKTENDGVTYSVQDTETILITDKYNGYIRYYNGFHLWGNSSCDSHYVAFSTDRPIDTLLEADVYYVAHSERQYTYTQNPFIPSETTVGANYDGYKYLTCNQQAENPAEGWRGKKYTWKRIESVDEFLKKEELTGIVKENVSDKKWVLRFFESPYTSVITTGNIDTNYIVVTSVSILRLKFVTDGVTYDLGVVDNKQSGGRNPSNTNTHEKEDFFVWLARITGVPQWVWILAVVLVCLAILLPVLSVIFPVFGQFLLWLLKGLGWLICLPFKGIKALINKIRGE